MIGDLFLHHEGEGLQHQFATLGHGEGFGKMNHMPVGRIVGDRLHVTIISESLFEEELFGRSTDIV